MSGYAVADRVAWMATTHEDDEVVYAARLPDGPPLTLPGSAAIIFTAATDGGTLEDILTRVVDVAGLPADEVRDDVTAFLAQLVDLGLVTLR